MPQASIISRKEAKAAGLSRYFTGEPCKRGHLSERSTALAVCIECDRIRCCERARLLRRDESSGYAEADRSRQKALRADPVKVNEIRRRQRERGRRNRQDPVKGFALRASSLIRVTLKNGRWKKPSKTEQILGCSMDEFRRQIELQFKPGMSWENMGDWHLDHIVPISSAKSQSEAESLSRAGNFRPVWATENLSKSNKVLYLI